MAQRTHTEELAYRVSEHLASNISDRDMIIAQNEYLMSLAGMALGIDEEGKPSVNRELAKAVHNFCTVASAYNYAQGEVNCPHPLLTTKVAEEHMFCASCGERTELKA